jgi:hypothetical protein
MRALWVLPFVIGCQSILGDYELGPTDSGTDSVTTTDTAVTDTGTTETGSKATSCKEKKAKDPTASDGPIEVQPGVKAFCDMRRQNGGWTLVAMRASNTDGSAWTGEPAPLKTQQLDKPDENRDMVLDINWTLLGFTEVRYELGIDLNGSMPRYGEIATFAMLDPGKQAAARDALKQHIFRTDRPSCTLGADPPSAPIDYCFSMTMPPAGEDPKNSYGWVYMPQSTVCYFAETGKVGSPGCATGKVGAARVWVR